MERLTICLLVCLALITSSCGTIISTSSSADGASFDKKQFRHSKAIASYSGIANEFEDGYLELKENGYFKFYLKFWMVVTVKAGEYTGRYSKQGKTIHLNWLSVNPKDIKPYLSSTCEVDSMNKKLSFVNDATGAGAMLWSMAKR